MNEKLDAYEEKGHPLGWKDWRVPEIKLKAMTIDGEKCCQFGTGVDFYGHPGGLNYRQMIPKMSSI